jgi:glycosyltransferase involved in cell wall biosynthesis
VSGAGHAVENPLVSVIIPAYNVAAFIGETVRSATAQNYQPFEVIVIDDGSPDAPALRSALEPYAAQIILLEQENRGVAAARNAGLRAARGEYVAFLDGDDVWVPEFLAEQVKLIRSNGGYDLVYANAFHFGDGWERTTYMETSPSVGDVTCESLLAGRCNVISSTVLARREAIFDAGLFDESLRSSEDFDLWVRISKRNGSRLTYQRQVLAGYRHRPSSLSADPDELMERSLKAFNKIAQRDDLSVAERAALAATVRSQKAALAIGRGKRKLLKRSFAEARDRFAEAEELCPSWKLRLISVWLKTAPRTCRTFYRLYLRSTTDRAVREDTLSPSSS